MTTANPKPQVAQTMKKSGEEPGPVMDSPFPELVREMEQTWSTERYNGITRDFSAEDVLRLRGSFKEEHTIARMGAERLWWLLTEKKKGPFVRALGAVTGMQAVQMVRAGLDAIYVSGWQVAADGQSTMYPDQSLYPCSAVPDVVEKLNNALQAADRLEWNETKGNPARHWMVPLIADGDSGFGGPLNVFELTKRFIKAGAAAIHLEDQVAAEKKCGHLGGKVLIATSAHIRNLQAARLAADVMGTPTLVIARTDANAATLLTSDIDERDRQFILPDSTRTAEGYFRVKHGMESVLSRVLAYCPYADLVWVETSTPSMEEAEIIARTVHEKFPGKMLAYNCSPSFNWRKHLSEEEIRNFQERLGALGYVFQFVTLAGFHTITSSMFELAHGYKTEGMGAFVKLQDREFALESSGFSAVKHQHEVGTGYYDSVSNILGSATAALKGSTETEQFHH